MTQASSKIVNFSFVQIVENCLQTKRYFFASPEFWTLVVGYNIGLEGYCFNASLNLKQGNTEWLLDNNNKTYVYNKSDCIHW